MTRRRFIIRGTAVFLGALLAVAGPVAARKAEAARADEPAPFAGDDLIAYVCVDSNASHICTIKPDGTDKKVIPGTDGGFSPTWSPDGRLLAFSQGDGFIVSANNHVFVVDGATGANKTDLGNGSLPDWGPGDPSSDPDNTHSRIMVVRGPDPSESALYGATTLWTTTIPTVSRPAEQLEVGYGHGRQIDPTWLPDGKHILYSYVSTISSDYTQGDIWEQHSAGRPEGSPPDSNYDSLTFEPRNGVSEYQPAVSPDGQLVAFSECTTTGEHGACQQDKTRIAIGTLGGDHLEDRHAIVPPSDQWDDSGKPAMWQVDPAWSPDGTRLAYAAFSKGLMVVTPDGDHLAHVPNTSPRDRSPAWRPTVVDLDQEEILSVAPDGTPKFRFSVGETINVRINTRDSGSACLVAESDKDRGSCPLFESTKFSVTPDPKPYVTELETRGVSIDPGDYRLLFHRDDGSPVLSPRLRVVCDGRCDGSLHTLSGKRAAQDLVNTLNGDNPLGFGCEQMSTVATWSGVVMALGFGLGGVVLAPSFATYAMFNIGMVLAVASLAELKFADDIPPLVSPLKVSELGNLVNPLGWIIFGLDSGCRAARFVAQKIANDPPDSNYAEVQAPDLSQVTNLDASRPESRARTALDRVDALGEAFLVALERSQGAGAAGDVEAEARQIAEMGELANEISASLSDASVGLAQTADDIQQDPLSAQLPSQDSLDRLRLIQEDIRSNGLPDAVIDRLHQLGLDDTAIADGLDRLADVDFTRVPSTTPVDGLRALAANIGASAEQWNDLSRQERLDLFGILPAPAVKDDSIEVGRDTPTDITLNAVDPEDGLVSFQVVAAPAHGHLDGFGGELTYVPDPGYLGPDSFTWTASNDLATSPSATMSINVLLPAPQGFADDYGTNTTSTLTVPAPGVLTNDLGESVPMTAELVTPPSEGNVVLKADGSFTYTPRPEAHGGDHFTYKARTPGSAASSPTTATIHLVDANHPPVAAADLLTIDEDTSGSIDVLANDTDADGDHLTFTGVHQPRHGAIVCLISTCTYTPTPDFSGSDLVAYTVSDGQGTISTGYLNVVVRPVEEPPRPVDDLAGVDPGQPVTINVLANDSDPDGDPISFVSNGNPTSGTATCTSAGVCTYTPNDVDVSADQFTYTIVDSHGHQASATVHITDEPPMIVSDGPLVDIITGNTLSCSVDYSGDSLGSFFNDVGCGTFLATGGTLYGQTFTGVGLNPPQPRTFYDPVSQSRLTGSGTTGDPYKVVTVVKAGTSGLTITQTDSYVVGEESYRTDIAVTNTGAGSKSAVLYRGGDCQLGDSDTGFGRRDAATGNVTCTDAAGRILEWQPITPGSSSIETDPDTFWDAIASQQPFPNTCRCTEDIDNAGGLSWNVTIPAGQTITESHRTVFSPTGQKPLSMQLTADVPTAVTGGDDGYRLTITNSNTAGTAAVDHLSLRLPDGFVYRTGTTSGAWTDEPNALGRDLTWTKAATIAAGASISLHVGLSAADTPGTYSASATASGAQAIVQPTGDTAPIQVTDDIPPIAAFTANGPALTLGFDGTGSLDLDGTIASYAWNFGDGTTGAGPTPTHTYATAGTYAVALTVTDDLGATGTTTTFVAARNPNVVPVATFTATTTGLSASLDGTGSHDDDGTIVSYTWDFGDGSSGWGPHPPHTYSASGTHAVALTVTDDRGGTATTSNPVDVVEPDNIPPIASFRATPAALSAAFDGTDSTDPDASDGRVASYSWDFGDGEIGTGPSPGHTYAASGTYTVVLTVADAKGATGSTSRALFVAADHAANAPPAATFDPTVADLTVNVDGQASTDADGTIVGYDWDFADLGFADGATSTFTFPDPGTYPIRLMVTDNDGATSVHTASVTVPEGSVNQPPTAAFSSTTTNLDVAFDGSASHDPDGTVAGYEWTFGDGTSASGAQPSHTYASAGTYTVTLTVTDDKSMAGAITHQVVVNAPPPDDQPPNAAFSAAPEGLTVALDGTGSNDPDGSIASFNWAFGDGTTGTGAQPTHTYAGSGTYTVTLTVTDDRGATASIDHAVTVTKPPVNEPPGAAFSATPTGLAVAFDGTGSSDPDGSVVSYSWAFGDTGSATGSQPSHTYVAAGTYEVTLTVHDDDGAVGEVTHLVTVAPNANHPPVARFDADPSGLGVSVNASTSSDDDGTITTYAWTFGDATVGSGVAPSHIYAAAGTYDVTLTVTDDDGASSAVTHSVTVVAPPPGNEPPNAAFVFTAAGLHATFDASGSTDLDGTIASYNWSFGDDSSGSGATPDHTYAADGTYTVTLTVTDERGATDAVGHDVAVQGVNHPPVASFAATPTALDVAFDAHASSDDDGAVVSYVWSFADGSSGTGVSPSHTYAAAGSYEVTLTVTDDRGATGSVTHTVDIRRRGERRPPTASFTHNANGLAVTFDASDSTSPDGTIVTWAWTFGETGSGASNELAGPGSVLSHRYLVAGTYHVTLTVTDDSGATSSSEADVAVDGPPATAAPSTTPDSGVGVEATQVTVAPAQPLPRTGADIAAWIWRAVLTLLAGAFFVAAARRRRRRIRLQ